MTIEVSSFNLFFCELSTLLAMTTPISSIENTNPQFLKIKDNRTFSFRGRLKIPCSRSLRVKILKSVLFPTIIFGKKVFYYVNYKIIWLDSSKSVIIELDRKSQQKLYFVYSKKKDITKLFYAPK